MQREIPIYDPYTGELNPYYEELTGEKNPFTNIDTKEVKITYHIKEERLDNGCKRFYPIKRITYDNYHSWNEEFILNKWFPEKKEDYCQTYDLAFRTIQKEKTFQLDLSGEVIETIIHQV